MSIRWTRIHKTARDLLTKFEVGEPPVPVRKLARGQERLAFKRE